MTAELAMIALEEIRALEEIVADELFKSVHDVPSYPRHLELAEL